MLTIQELAEEVYEDSNGNIDSLEWIGVSLNIIFSCNSWVDYKDKLVFRITCEDVKISRVSPQRTWMEFMWYEENDPVLSIFREPTAELYFESELSSALELLGKLWSIQYRIYKDNFPFDAFLNVYEKDQKVLFGEGLGGLIARGPLSLLELFQTEAEQHTSTKMTVDQPQKSDVVLLRFSESGFVVCGRVKVEKLSGKI
jgi:hypothetical protein